LSNGDGDQNVDEDENEDGKTDGGGTLRNGDGDEGGEE